MELFQVPHPWDSHRSKAGSIYRQVASAPLPVWLDLLLELAKEHIPAFLGEIGQANNHVKIFAESLEIRRIHALLAYNDMDVEAPPEPQQAAQLPSLRFRFFLGIKAVQVRASLVESQNHHILTLVLAILAGEERLIEIVKYGGHIYAGVPFTAFEEVKSPAAFTITYGQTGVSIF